MENRIRFPLKVVKEVKERVREKLLMYRLGADDLNPNGIKIEDARRFALKLQNAGVDIIDVSGGLCGSTPEKLKGTQGYFVPQARQIKEAVGVPVLGVGGIKKPKFAIDRSKDPEWAVNALQILEKR